MLFYFYAKLRKHMHAWKIEMTATFNLAKYVRWKRAESLSWRNARRVVWPMNTHVTEVTSIGEPSQLSLFIVSRNTTSPEIKRRVRLRGLHGKRAGLRTLDIIQTHHYLDQPHIKSSILQRYRKIARSHKYMYVQLSFNAIHLMCS